MIKIEEKDPIGGAVLFVTSLQLGGIGGGCSASQGYASALRALFGSRVVTFSLDPKNTQTVNVESAAGVERRSPGKGIAEFLLKARGIGKAAQVALELIKERHLALDLVFLDGSLAIGAAPEFVRHAPVIAIHHNYEPDYWRDSGAAFLQRTVMQEIASRAQRLAWRKATLNFVLSDQDRSVLERIVGPAPSSVTGIGITTVQIDARPNPSGRQPEHIAVTGNFNVPRSRRALLDGLLKISSHTPSPGFLFEFIVAGRGSSCASAAEAALAARGHRLTIVESPDDILKAISGCSVYWNPSHHGSGVKVRNSDGLQSGHVLVIREENIAGYSGLPEWAVCAYGEAGDPYPALCAAVSTVRRFGVEKSASQIRGLFESEFSMRALSTRIASSLRQSRLSA